MRISTLVPVLVFGALLGCDAGGPGAVGSPCNTADDCESGLICDEHNGQGSCQEPHGHTGGETTDDSGSGSATTGDATSSTTSGGTETPDETSTGPGESSSTTSDDPTTAETGGNSELCAAYCGCLQDTCTSYDGYPYADEAACLTACEAFDDVVLQCYGSFCQQAIDSEATLVEHYCQHAWGELGTEKC